MKRLFFLALVSASLLVAGCDSDNEPPAEASVRVMSQNVYLGGDLFTVVAETDPQLVPVRVAQLYGTIQASNPAERMAAIAAEIASIEPDLVGLQEISTYFTQSPADNLPGGAATAATDKTFDFLELLLDALDAEGANYTVVSRSDNSDVEFPATADGVTFFDVRYQDADVILAREGLTTSNPQETTFGSLLAVEIGGVEQTFERAYQSVDVTLDGLTFTFINAHLEVGGQATIFQQAQGSELAIEVAGTSGPLVLVGDFNSDAGGTTTATYGILTDPSTGLVDAAGPGAGTPTCCQDAEIRNDASEHTTRIDLIFSRNGTATAFDTILDEPADKTASGLWPSDHAGVWADLTLRSEES
ncbi:MAG: endonuclease/exonuclease/phosphatase family protein [Bacteroidota bacterium]